MAVQTVSQMIWGPSASIPDFSIEQPIPVMSGIVPPAPVAEPETWSEILCSVNQAVTAHPVVAALGIVAGYFLLKDSEKKPKTTTRRTR